MKNANRIWLENAGHELNDEEFQVFEEMVSEFTQDGITSLNEARLYAIMGFVES
jgi:hypothetical protein